MAQFQHYPPFAGKSLERLLESGFDAFKVPLPERRRVRAMLAPLRYKHPVTEVHYQHSIRVGLLCKAIAEFMGIDQKACFYPGLLHDIGKALVPIDILGKTDGWTQADHEVVKKHVVLGHAQLSGAFDFSAEVMLLHHRYQQNGYPRTLPKCKVTYSPGTRVTIDMCGRILALADCYDALHRVSNRDGTLRVRTGDEIYEVMQRLNEDQSVLLDNLYAADIFTRRLAKK